MSSPTLSISNLNVYYGSSHVLQNVSLELGQGVHAILGRNGVGKTTLCNALMGLVPIASGSISYKNRSLVEMPPHERSALGIAYTPQGRRLWESLSVDEHLRLCEKKGGAWNADRIYATFPRLRERATSGATQLSGGEQQMLAIARALLRDPSLLIFDEPTEGLAPVVVEQVEQLLTRISQEGGVTILLVEQNVAVATNVAKDVAIMLNGAIEAVVPSARLAANRELQQNLLGVGMQGELDDHLELDSASGDQQDEADTAPAAAADASAYPGHWGGGYGGNGAARSGAFDPQSRPFDLPVAPLYQESAQSAAPAAATVAGSVLVAGTFSTKSRELGYLRDQLLARQLPVRTVDLSTTGEFAEVDITSQEVASHHPRGTAAVFTGDRGSAIKEMASAFELWLAAQRDVRGIISAAGSGGTALATQAMRGLPVGVPKVMISTVASGEVSRYVGASDIMMMYSVTDVQGINQISTQILGNGAAALAGMLAARGSAAPAAAGTMPCLGLTMFGVTTPAVQQITELLRDQYECLVFHATGIGGQSMEKLVDSGMLGAVIDLTTTEVCDLHMGGVFPATEDRFGAFIRRPVPYVVSLGALDMVNFGPRDSVPEKYADRLFYEHNPFVTLMRTTPAENALMGEWIAGRLNRVAGPLRLLVPEKGVSALDAPGMPFHDPAANKELIGALTRHLQTSPMRKISHVPCHINDPLFAQSAIKALQEISA